MWEGADGDVRGEEQEKKQKSNQKRMKEETVDKEYLNNSCMCVPYVPSVLSPPLSGHPLTAAVLANDSRRLTDTP